MKLHVFFNAFWISLVRRLQRALFLGGAGAECGTDPVQGKRRRTDSGALLNTAWMKSVNRESAGFLLSSAARQRTVTRAPAFPGAVRLAAVACAQECQMENQNAGNGVGVKPMSVSRRFLSPDRCSTQGDGSRRAGRRTRKHDKSRSVPVLLSHRSAFRD